MGLAGDLSTHRTSHHSAVTIIWDQDEQCESRYLAEVVGRGKLSEASLDNSEGKMDILSPSPKPVISPLVMMMRNQNHGFGNH